MSANCLSVYKYISSISPFWTWTIRKWCWISVCFVLDYCIFPFRWHYIGNEFFFDAEEVLLENVELILEAFDYLQLPFAHKQGVVNQPLYGSFHNYSSGFNYLLRLIDMFLCYQLCCFYAINIFRYILDFFLYWFI